MRQNIRIIGCVCVAAVLAGIGRVTHSCASGRSYNSFVAVRLLINIVALVFVTAFRTGVNGITKLCTSCRCNCAVVMMLCFVSIVTYISIPAAITGICCKAHSCASRESYVCVIMMTCRHFKDSSASLAYLRLGTSSGCAGLMTCCGSCLYHLFITVFTVIFHNALTAAR